MGFGARVSAQRHTTCASEETEHRRRCRNRILPRPPPARSLHGPGLIARRWISRIACLTAAAARSSLSQPPPHAGAAAARFVPRQLESHGSWPASANSNRPGQPPRCLYLPGYAQASACALSSRLSLSAAAASMRAANES